MGYIICLLIAIGGALIGAILGALISGYLIIFKSFEWMQSASNVSELVKIGEAIFILFFSKATIIFGTIIGSFFGAIPGIIGMTKFSDDD